MIANTTEPTIDARKITDQDVARQVARGQRQVAFTSEFNPAIKASLKWFLPVISAADIAVTGSPTPTNKMEHMEAFALQRDINYAYAPRTRLMDIGHDSRLEEPFMARMKNKLNQPL